MSVAHLPKPAFRLTGWHVLAMFVAFFGVVIAVDVSFLVVAYRTHPGQVSVTPYQDGILYNNHIAQLEAQAKLGWRAAAGAETGKVLVELVDGRGRLLSGLSLTGKLERPATEVGRVVPHFVEVSAGHYEARVGGLSGAWDLSAEAQDRAGHRFHLERRLSWP